VLVEADQFGGMIGARYGLGQTPGLSSLAAFARRGLDRDAVWRHVQQLPGGVPVLVGPASADEAHAVLRDLAGVLAEWSSGESGLDVIIDCGRMGPGSPGHELFARADVAMVLVRPQVDQLRVAADRLAALDTLGVDARLLLIGDRPYGPAEVASTIQAVVAGVIAWDPRAAAMLDGTAGASRNLRRSLLVRSAVTLADHLTASLPPADRDLPDAGPNPVEVGTPDQVRR
jgi:hypothetical protein